MKLYETHQLDEEHPMTRMMKKAYGLDKDKAKKEEKCRGCGAPEVVMKGLCKDCAEDTYVDRD